MEEICCNKLLRRRTPLLDSLLHLVIIVFRSSCISSFRYRTVAEKVSRRESSRLTRRNAIHSPVPVWTSRSLLLVLWQSNRTVFLPCDVHSCETTTSFFHARRAWSLLHLHFDASAGRADHWRWIVFQIFYNDHGNRVISAFHPFALLLY